VRENAESVRVVERVEERNGENWAFFGFLYKKKKKEEKIIFREKGKGVVFVGEEWARKEVAMMIVVGKKEPGVVFEGRKGALKMITCNVRACVSILETHRIMHHVAQQSPSLANI